MKNKFGAMSAFLLASAFLEGSPGKVARALINREPEIEPCEIEEYKLIQKKKSNLSRSKRAAIVAKVNWLVKKGRINPELLTDQKVKP